MSFPSYPEYRPAKATWLSSIPAHWEESRLRFLVYINPTKKTLEGLKNNPLVSFLPMEAIREDGSIDLTQTCDADDVKNGYTPVKEGDVVIAKITPCFENGKGALLKGLVNGKGFGTTELVVLRTKGRLDPRFLHYLMRSYPVRDLGEYEMYGAGGQKRVPGDFFRDLRIGVPEKKEQQKISQFLDHQTAKIGRLIEKQQRLIKLLEEKQQSLVSRVVTQGLGSGVQMKDSGLEWFGGIPAHWAKTRLKFECAAIVDCLHSTPDYVENGDCPVIRTADITPGKLDLINARHVSFEEYRQRNVRLTPSAGDIIYAREGERFGIAADIPSNVRVCLGQRVMLFRPRDRNDTKFLMWALNSRSVHKQAEQDVIGATSPHVNVETIRNFTIPWPPKNERIKIGDCITWTTNRIFHIKDAVSNQINLLREHRTALISAAVTGKIDVRDWEPPETAIEASKPAEALNG